MKTMRIICTALACVLLLAACAKPPTVEMNNATEAVARAENDTNAVLYAPNSVARARDALDRMQREADSKRYDAAKTYAAEAVAAAEKAIADGQSGALRARDEAAELITELKPAIAETEHELGSARTKGLDVDLPALNSEFGEVKLNAEEAETALSDSQYQQALEKGRSARAGLSDINRQLSDAIISSSRKK